MRALLFLVSILTSPVPIVWMICLSGSRREGFLPKLLNLYVVNLRESSCLARLIIEPSLGYGVSCPHATACSTAIKRGSVFVAPYWASL